MRYGSKSQRYHGTKKKRKFRGKVGHTPKPLGHLCNLSLLIFKTCPYGKRIHYFNNIVISGYVSQQVVSEPVVPWQ